MKLNPSYYQKGLPLQCLGEICIYCRCHLCIDPIGRFFYESLFRRFKFNNGNPIVKTKIENLSRYKNLDKICYVLDKFGLIQGYGYKTGDEYGFIHFDSVNDAQAAVNFISTYSLDESNVCLQIEPCLAPKSTPFSENEDDDSVDSVCSLDRDKNTNTDMRKKREEHWSVIVGDYGNSHTRGSTME